MMGSGSGIDAAAGQISLSDGNETDDEVASGADDGDEAASLRETVVEAVVVVELMAGGSTWGQGLGVKQVSVPGTEQ